jgi:hypothetical protein
MLKCLTIAIVIFLANITSAAARECAAVFNPTATTGLVTRMTLYKFADHYELQFLTPSQLPLLDMTAELDGVPQKVFQSGGLDDELFMITDDENGIAASQAMLAALAKAGKLEVRGRNANGKAETAVFALKGFGAATKKMPKGCK